MDRTKKHLSQIPTVHAARVCGRRCGGEGVGERVWGRGCGGEGEGERVRGEDGYFGNTKMA